MNDLKTEPYWWEGGDPLPELSPEPLRNVELAIIGGGYTGLSAALTAAERGVETLVLDAAQPGQGASTRNGGMIGAPHRPELLAQLAKGDAGYAGRMLAEGAEAYAYTKSLYTERGIDAGYRQSGRIVLAYTRDHFEGFRTQAELLNKYTRQGVQLLGEEEIGQHIRTDRYFGAMLMPEHGGLHPRRAHDGLMRLAMEAGATIAAPCAVTGIARDGDGFRLSTAYGEVRAKRVIQATNGYTTPMNRWLSRRIFPIPSFIIATEELPPEVIDRVAPGRRMMVESRARHSYFRPSPDGKRILFGARASLTAMDPAEAAKINRKIMCEIWPEAASWKITHAWTGNTGFTFGLSPHVGEREGVHFAMGYCGNGVALSPWLGRKAALRALGDPEGDTAFASTPLETRPYHLGGRPWFMALGNLWWNHVVDKGQVRRAARDRAAR